jgi:hypothetical protein
MVFWVIQMGSELIHKHPRVDVFYKLDEKTRKVK